MHRHPCHPNLHLWPVLRIHLHPLHRIQRPTTLRSIDHLSDNGIFSIQVRLFRVRDEELRLVGVRSCVGTRYDASPVEFEGGANLVGEGFAPDRLSAFTGACGIAGLDHEVFDVAVPFDVVVGASGAVA